MEPNSPTICTVFSTNVQAYNESQSEIGDDVSVYSEPCVATAHISKHFGQGGAVMLTESNDNMHMDEHREFSTLSTVIPPQQVIPQSDNDAENKHYESDQPKTQSNLLLIEAKSDMSNNAYIDLIGTYCSPAPFSHDPRARQNNAQCDYSIRITAEMARTGKAPRPVRVYADGVYDVFHSGHARQLMQAKRAFPNVYLIVGVANDTDVRQFKGRTVMNEKERYETVRHCRYVDEVLCDAPWSVTDEFVQQHKIDFVAHDDLPYSSPDSEDIYKPFKEAGMFVATQRTEGISTTDVIGRIVRDYDIYLRRNIRRGLSRKDLNISYMKEQSLKIQDNLQTMMERGSSFLQNFDSKRREFLDQLEDMSHEVLRSFMRIFGAEGPLRHWFAGKKRKISYSSTTLPPVDNNESSSNTMSSDEENDDFHDFAKTVAPSKLARCKLAYNSGSSSPSSDYDSTTYTNGSKSATLLLYKDQLSDSLDTGVMHSPLRTRNQRKMAQRPFPRSPISSNQGDVTKISSANTRKIAKTNPRNRKK